MSRSRSESGPVPEESPAAPAHPRLGRRALLTGGAVGIGLGAVLGAGSALGLTARRTSGSATPDAAAAEAEQSLGTGGKSAGFGGERLPCHGAHQAGIVSVPAAHVQYLAYRLLPDTDAAALGRMFRILTGDIEGLSSGAAPLADPEPELAARPARLSLTVGVGPELVNRIDPALRPAWLAPLPAFQHDALDGRFEGGDLLIIVQADDLLPIAHATRMLQRDLRSFAEPLWSQTGFRQARGAESDGTTMRNLMGQVDGTVNPSEADEDFADLVWLDDRAGWLAGGSAFVLRRIRMELDTWDQVDRPGREHTIGRRLADGAPLTGGTEHTPADFDAKDALGFPVIAAAAHIRRARSEDPSERIFRRAVNYADADEAGLLFACYQRDPLRQFVPIQQRLDELDMLNQWITHTGSAVFAILPGFRPGEMLGQSLLA